MLKRFKSITILALSVTILGQGVSSVVYAKEKNEEQPIGHWMKGEYHAHTTQSDDAQQSQTVQLLLDKAFDTYSMDWIAISDHLRMSSRDAEGNTVPDGPIPLSQGLAQYQIPKIKELQEAGKYKNKIIFSCLY